MKRPSACAARTVSRTSVGELTALLPSWRTYLEAANLSPERPALTPMTGTLLAAFLARQGMPTAAGRGCFQVGLSSIGILEEVAELRQNHTRAIRCRRRTTATCQLTVAFDGREPGRGTRFSNGQAC
jgi:hypothetical protein